MAGFACLHYGGEVLQGDKLLLVLVPDRQPCKRGVRLSFYKAEASTRNEVFRIRSKDTLSGSIDALIGNYGRLASKKVFPPRLKPAFS